MKTSKWRRVLITSIAVVLIELLTSCNQGGEKTVKEKQLKDSPLFEKAGKEVIVGCSSYYSDEHTPLKFIDDNDDTFWHSGKTFGWISVSFIKPFKASKYLIERRRDIVSQVPVDFVLEGTMDDELMLDKENNWKIIDEQKGQEWTEPAKIYRIENPKDYKHYRIRILKTGDQCFASIAEWHLLK